MNVFNQLPLCSFKLLNINKTKYSYCATFCSIFNNDFNNFLNITFKMKIKHHMGQSL